MKTIKIRLNDAVGVLVAICLALILMLGSCGRGAGVSIAGTYVSYESGEYSISKDTLLILSSAEKDNYRLIRRSGFQRIREGKLRHEEMQVREYTGKYDTESLVLQLDGDDRQIRFFPGAKSLLLAKREYRKVTNP